jgi:hypothetical protein
LKQNSGFLKKEKLERFIGLRRLRDKESLSSVLAPPVAPPLPTDENMSIAKSLSNMLKSSPLSTSGSTARIKTIAKSQTPVTNKAWTSLQDPKGIEKYLSDTSRLIAMAREEMYGSIFNGFSLVQKILMKPKLSDDDLISALYSDTKTRDFTISAHTNLILLDALLNTGKFEEYFTHVNQLTSISSLSFARTTLTHVRVFATEKLGQYVNGVYQKASQKIMTAIQAGQSLDLPPPGNPGADSANPVLTESLVSSIRCFKDGFVLVIRASVVLAGMPRVDKVCYEYVGKAFAEIVLLLRYTGQFNFVGSLILV